MIGYRWKCSDVWSRVVLIARKLLILKKQTFNARTIYFALFFIKREKKGTKDLLAAVAKGITSYHSEQRS